MTRQEYMISDWCGKLANGNARAYPQAFSERKCDGAWCTCDWLPVGWLWKIQLVNTLPLCLILRDHCYQNRRLSGQGKECDLSCIWQERHRNLNCLITNRNLMKMDGQDCPPSFLKENNLLLFVVFQKCLGHRQNLRNMDKAVHGSAITFRISPPSQMK